MNQRQVKIDIYYFLVKIQRPHTQSVHILPTKEYVSHKQMTLLNNYYSLYLYKETYMELYYFLQWMLCKEKVTTKKHVSTYIYAKDNSTAAANLGLQRPLMVKLLDL